MPWPRAIKRPPNWIFQKKCRTLIYIHTLHTPLFGEAQRTDMNEKKIIPMIHIIKCEEKNYIKNVRPSLLHQNKQNKNLKDLKGIIVKF